MGQGDSKIAGAGYTNPYGDYPTKESNNKTGIMSKIGMFGFGSSG